MFISDRHEYESIGSIGSGPKQKLSNNDHHHQRSDFLKTHGEAIAAGLSGLLILLAWLSRRNLETFSVILYLTAYVIGGFAKAREDRLPCE